jgi:molybdate transport system ATP-binding protein
VLAAGSVEELTARTDLPLATRRDAGVVIPCTIAAHDAARGLTCFDFAGGSLLVPLHQEPIGTRLRLRLRARDISVALAPPRDISMQNLLPAELRDVAPTGSPHEVFLHLAVGETVLLARVTRDAVERLGLRPGINLWAMIKSVTFDRAGHARPESDQRSATSASSA